MLFSRSGILAEAINTNILTKNHPDSRHSHPDSTHSHHSPHSVPRFLIPTFTDSPKNVIFVFLVSTKKQKEWKRICNWISLNYVSQIGGKIFTTVFFHGSLGTQIRK